MRIKASVIACLSFAGLMAAVPAVAGSLCVAGEKPRFQCEMAQAGKTLSLCQQGEHLRYRFGALTKPELELPDPTAPSRPYLVTEDSPVSDARGIAFARGVQTYVVTHFVGGRPPVDEHYVSVRTDGRPSALLKCSARVKPQGDLRQLFNELQAQGWRVIRE